jgi:IclR family transcriptional regulator, acetate operon repressor
MMRNGTPQIAALKRTLIMLETVLRDGGASSVSALARIAGIPVATAHRQVRTLIAEGYLTPVGQGGRHVAGPALRAMLALIDDRQVIMNAAADPLHQLAAETGAVVQLGTLDNDMVTYRLKYGQAADALFTKVGMQLEAYCSGIGKVLLANLPRAERSAYLANGPFVPLTSRTITDADVLAQELEQVAIQGYATDREEIIEGLSCIAVPLRYSDGNVLAAISFSRACQEMDDREFTRLLGRLQQTARMIEQAIVGRLA